MKILVLLWIMKNLYNNFLLCFFNFSFNIFNKKWILLLFRKCRSLLFKFIKNIPFLYYTLTNKKWKRISFIYHFAYSFTYFLFYDFYILTVHLNIDCVKKSSRELIYMLKKDHLPHKKPTNVDWQKQRQREWKSNLKFWLDTKEEEKCYIYWWIIEPPICWTTNIKLK